MGTDSSPGRDVSRTQSLKLGTAALSLPILVGYGVQLLTTPYVVGKLGLHDFGIWSMTGAVAQYAALMDLGVSRACGRYIALFHAKKDAKSEGAVVVVCVAALTALGLLLSGLAFLGAPAADRLLRTGEPGRASFLLWCAVAIMVLALLTRIFSSISTGHGRLVQAGIGLAVLSTFQALGGIASLLLRPSLEAFAVGTLCGASLGLVAMIGIVIIDERRIPCSMPSVAIAREVFSYGLKSQAGNAGDILQLQSGKLIAGIIIGPAAAGIYDLASKLALGAQAFAAAAGGALVPHLTRSFVAGGIERTLNEYERLTQRSTAAVIFIPFVMAATAFSAVPLWLNASETQVIWLLLALLPGIAINASTVACSSTASAVGRPGIRAQVSVLSGLFLVVAAVALGKTLGFMGIGIAFALGFPLATVVGVWYMQMRLQIPQKLYFRGIAGPFLIAAVATAAAAPIGIIIAPERRSSAVWPLLGSAMVFTTVYMLLAWRSGYLASAQSRLKQYRLHLTPARPRQRHRRDIGRKRLNDDGSQPLTEQVGHRQKDYLPQPLRSPSGEQL